VRVLFLYPYAVGSVASFVRPANIIKRLLARGVKVTLATVCHLRRASTDINLSLLEFPYLKSVPHVRLFAERGAVLRNTLIVNRLLRSHDIVHLQKCHPIVSIPATIASALSGKPLHYDWDDNETEILRSMISNGVASAGQAREFAFVERRLVRLVDTISVASQRLRSLALQYGASPDALFDAPVGADLSLFAPRRFSREELDSLGVRPPMVLYQGQLEEASFAEAFVECAVRVAEAVPEAQFVVVGGGAKLERLRELAVANRVPVTFTGYISHRMVAEYVSAATVCVATFPDTELVRCKSPLKIAEYLASGGAIVASEVGDVPRMVSGAGILVPPGDIGGLAEGIVLLLRDASLRAKLGALARKRAEQEFNWERTTASILSAYREALEGRGRAQASPSAMSGEARH